MEERLERRLRRRRLATRPTKLGGHASADQGGERGMIEVSMAIAMAISNDEISILEGLSEYGVS